MFVFSLLFVISFYVVVLFIFFVLTFFGFKVFVWICFLLLFLFYFVFLMCLLVGFPCCFCVDRFCLSQSDRLQVMGEFYVFRPLSKVGWGSLVLLVCWFCFVGLLVCWGSLVLLPGFVFILIISCRFSLSLF